MSDPAAPKLEATALLHVYFPNDALVSLLALADGHLALEVGMVGHEGMLGIPVALGINDSPVRALVQGTGTALRMTSARFRSEHGTCEPLRRELNRCIHERIVQITQTAACNRFHPIEGRLARWLLMTRDRMVTNHFRITQEILGHMLGVLRVAVTNAAGDLQQRKLIRYSRGEISILDGNGLEAAACQCYQIVKNVHDRARDRQTNHKNPPIAAAALRSDDEIQSGARGDYKPPQVNKEFVEKGLMRFSGEIANRK